MTRVRTRSLWVLAIAVASLMCAVAASASTITVLGSGLDNNGNCLAGGFADPHYMVTSGPSAVSGPNAIVVDAGGLPCGTIAQSNSLSPGNGLITYTTTFDLTGYDASTASITGTWGGDDAPGGVYMNGQAITWTSTPATNCCFFSGTYSASSGFVSGVNTLSFVINQEDNWYDYARIGDGTITVQQSAPTTTPEPSSFVLLGSALAFTGRILKRKRSKQ